MKSFLVILFLTLVLCIGIVVVLFKSSENVIERKNPFVRSFMPRLITWEGSLNLEYNSYYYSGLHEKNLVLGNITAPLHALNIRTDFKRVDTIRIKEMDDKFFYADLRLQINPPYFFLVSGSKPIILKGFLNSWKPVSVWSEPIYFNRSIPVDSTKFIFRSNRSDIGDNVLGKLDLEGKEEPELFLDLIKRQVGGDGIFDTDGSLLFDSYSKKIVYLHRYRNQYLVANQNGQLIFKGKTIDTIAKAKIKITELEGSRRMSSAPLIVNHTAELYHNLLFVHSGLRGKYDSLKAFKTTATIDVYDIQFNTYKYSFYLPDVNGERLREFFIADNKLYALNGSTITSYSLSERLVKDFKKTNHL